MGELPGPAPATFETVVVDPLVQFDRSGIDWFSGVVVAAFVSVPVAIALGTGYATAGVLVALGTLNVFLGQGLLGFRARSRVAFLALGLNTVGIVVGSVVATTGAVAFPLIAVSIAGFELVNLVPYARVVGLTAGAMFAIGIGLSHTNPVAIGQTAELVLAGGAWALAGIFLQQAWIVNRRDHARRTGRPSFRWGRPDAALPSRPDARVVLATAIAAGVASAAAFAAGAHLGVDRDYWTILTVIVVLQVGFMATLNSAVVRMIGTVAGAAIGGLLLISLTGAWELGVLIALLAAITITLRSASPSLYVLSLTPWVLLILGITSDTGWVTAEARVLATLIGGGFALAGALLAWSILRLPWSARPSPDARSSLNARQSEPVR